MQTSTLIAVTPPAEAVARSHLLGVLEEALPVRFEPREASSIAIGADAILAFGEFDDTALSQPTPTMIIAGVPLTGAPASVTFTASAQVDRRLRGRTLAEQTHQPRQLPPGFGEVLATRGSAPVWATRLDAGEHATYLAACAPDELAADEPLMDRLRPRNFEALVPLVHFLRIVTAGRAWEPPPLRAIVHFDDPNLRWPSYGHLDYRKLLEHAERHDYHAAMAMIPLDARPVHPAAARLFREHRDRLSLLIHGLKHTHLELNQPVPAPARERAVAQALRSIEAFERRSGVGVSRIMCPPHGKASEQYLTTLMEFGVEALFANVPFPWLLGEEPRGTAPSDWHPRPPALASWHPVNFVAGGMPVMPRRLFAGDPDEIVLRAFLDHPLILYGHHEDAADALQTLDRAAQLVNSLGPVQWGSAAAIARKNVATRREGDTLAVRMLARRVDVTVSDQVTTLQIELSLVDGELDRREIVVTRADGRSTTLAAAPTIAIEASAGEVSIELRPRRRLNHRAVVAERPAPWPVLRRALTEGRDRLRPILG
jgi:hypothetical protein